MSGNKALRRAFELKDGIRMAENVPLIVDRSEFVTPEKAAEYLKKNKNNRWIDWDEVDKTKKQILNGEFKLVGQPIVLDPTGNILTGQTRLWAIVRANVGAWLRISQGTPAEYANLLDRGRKQTARHLASRKMERKPGPADHSIAKAISALRGNLKPTENQMSDIMVSNDPKADMVLAETKGTKKRKSIIMILAAICNLAKTIDECREVSKYTVKLADKLEGALLPETAEGCWGKGAAFRLAMEQSRKLVQEQINKKS